MEEFGWDDKCTKNVHVYPLPGVTPVTWLVIVSSSQSLFGTKYLTL